MVVAYRDLSGNNPTHHFLDRPTLRSAPAVEFGALGDPSAADISFPKFCRAIFIGNKGTNGSLAVIDRRGNSTVFHDLVAGSILDVQAGGTLASGTDVTEIIPLF